MSNDDSMQSLGGKARAEKLSPEQRSESARVAANARHAAKDNLPKADYDGDLEIGDALIKAAVLPDGRRLLVQSTFLQAIGRSPNPKAGTGGLITALDGLPSFLQAEQLKPFITDEIMASTSPVVFRLKSGQKAVGYDASLLHMVCEVYLKLRDAYAKQGKSVPSQYRHIVDACDMLIRGFARVGIIALVDEATGYQEVRDRQSLQEVLKKYLSGVLLEYASMFPITFYKELFRLKGWAWNNGKMPGVVGHYTSDLVYDRITPGLLAALREKNPVEESGRRKHKHFQWMSKEIGHPALVQHLYRLIGMMEAQPNGGWDNFKRTVDTKLPKLGQNLLLDLREEPNP